MNLFLPTLKESNSFIILLIIKIEKTHPLGKGKGFRHKNENRKNNFRNRSRNHDYGFRTYKNCGEGDGIYAAQ